MLTSASDGPVELWAAGPATSTRSAQQAIEARFTVGSPAELRWCRPGFRDRAVFPREVGHQPIRVLESLDGPPRLGFVEKGGELDGIGAARSEDV